MKCFHSFPLKSGSLIVSILEQIIKTEGFRGMYRGLSPTILALLPNWAVSNFSLHSSLQLHFANMIRDI